MKLIPQHIDGEHKQQDIHRVQHVARLRRKQSQPLVSGYRAKTHFGRW